MSDLSSQGVDDTDGVYSLQVVDSLGSWKGKIQEIIYQAEAIVNLFYILLGKLMEGWDNIFNFFS